MSIDHPIFLESVRLIRDRLGPTRLDEVQEDVLVRLIHTSGDFALADLLQFSPQACERGLQALREGASILTDTTMAKAAVAPMASRTLGTSVHCLLQWAPAKPPPGSTRSAVGMRLAWDALTSQAPPPVLLIGSAPTALEVMVDLFETGATAPSLVIGMPVGFIGVEDAKRRLAQSGLDQIRLDGTRGGAALVAASVNTLLRRANQGIK